MRSSGAHRRAPGQVYFLVEVICAAAAGLGGCLNGLVLAVILEGGGLLIQRRDSRGEGQK